MAARFSSLEESVVEEGKSLLLDSEAQQTALSTTSRKDEGSVDPVKGIDDVVGATLEGMSIESMNLPPYLLL